MSFTLLLAVTAAVAASMGYMAARKQGDEGATPGSEEDPNAENARSPRAKEQASTATKTPRKKPRGSPYAKLPLALGDVVTSGHEERWLAGALIAREGDDVLGALFLAPEGAVNKAVAVFAPPRKDCWWMSPIELSTPGEPPATIEATGSAGGTMDRKARLPVTLEKVGQGAPHVADDGIWAIYERGRDVALVIASGGKTYAWAGLRLDEHEYERLGGGGDA